ncbi:hypothetical protein B0H63DRAFT_486574 [Podospora didyma]|uniref:rRNA methyltransferase 1, mitochondrial n=1 Tax=Podospora didyma TaxID=330526 RepID=A0AAE0K508_9PEZI|nr:hypothetical protein B0H63DRAFT_486574 [Podospora didyma]
MALLVLHRAVRPAVLVNLTPAATISRFSRSYASLSTIHKGIRRSEKARPQGFRNKPAETGDGLTYAQRQAARAATSDPDFKIRKGKKDITDYPTKAKPTTRRARFYDEDSSFAKKSIGHQLKTGKLDDGLVREALGRSSRPDSGSRPSRSFDTPSAARGGFGRGGFGNGKSPRGRSGGEPRGSRGGFRSFGGDRESDRPERTPWARRTAPESGDRSERSERTPRGSSGLGRTEWAPRVPRGSSASGGRAEWGPRSSSGFGGRSERSFTPRTFTESGERSERLSSRAAIPRSEWTPPWALDQPSETAARPERTTPQASSETIQRPQSSTPEAVERPQKSAPRASFDTLEIMGRAVTRAPTAKSAPQNWDGTVTSGSSGGSGQRPSRSASFGSSDRRGRVAPRDSYGSGGRSDRAAPRSSSFDRSDRQSSTRPSSDLAEGSEQARPSYGSSSTYYDDGGSSRENRFRAWKIQQPLTVKYTTAASQFLYGRSVVDAALQSSRRKLYHLYIYGGSNRQNPDRDLVIEALARRKGIESTVVEEASGLQLLDKMSGGRPHNGYVLEASPLPQAPLTGLGPLAEEDGKPGYQINVAHQSAEELAVNGSSTFVGSSSQTHKPLVVVLDQVLDPGNLGSILRTVSFLGATAVAITKRGSASLTPVALKASSGASETLHLFSISSLHTFLAESRENGWSVYAAVPPTARSKQDRHLDMHEVEDMDPLSKEPCILLIGSEGEGLSRLVKNKADYEVNIPNLSGSAAVDSLNVSVATGLLCSAFMRGQVKAQFDIIKEEKQKTALW